MNARMRQACALAASWGRAMLRSNHDEALAVLRASSVPLTPTAEAGRFLELAAALRLVHIHTTLNGTADPTTRACVQLCHPGRGRATVQRPTMLR